MINKILILIIFITYYLKNKLYSKNNIYSNHKELFDIKLRGNIYKIIHNNYIKLAEELNGKIKCKFYLAGGEKDIELINKFKSSKIGKDSFSFENLSIK